VNPKLWPNLLSATRIGLMPAVLLSAVAGSRPWFIGLLATSLATDAMDGFLARRLNAYSEFGRKLDSVADYAVLLTGAAGIALLWPDDMKRELPWVISGLGAFFAVLIYGYARFGRPLGYHTIGAKVLGPLLALSMIPLLSGWAAWPFHLVIVLHVVSALEQLVIAVLIPSHSGEIASAWHAWRQRQDSMALLTPRRVSRISKRR
jgi:phosphatidylglycerophosphate synthase